MRGIGCPLSGGLVGFSPSLRMFPFDRPTLNRIASLSWPDVTFVLIRLGWKCFASKDMGRFVLIRVVVPPWSWLAPETVIL